MLGLDPTALRWLPLRARMDAVYGCFLDRVVVENLSNHRACQEHPEDCETWPRATDRFLRDNRAWGLGGTSFTLAYALRDLLRGVRANAHCTMGRNLVTEQVHAGVVAYVDDEPWLYDPGLLLSGPLPIRPGGKLEDPLGTILLAPQRGATLTVLMRMAGTTHPRPLYSIVPAPIPPHRFRQAWIASFYRGRRQPLRLARRVGDEIRRYSERPGRLEVLTPEGREQRDLGESVVDDLHLVFGIDRECLRAFFEG